MSEIVVHADIELWGTGWTRARLPALIADLPLSLVWCSNTERPDTAGGPAKPGELHVVYRDDGGSRRDLLLKDPAVGVTLIGHSRSDLPSVKAAAERLVALVEAEAPLDGASPVADVSDVLGPYTVPGGNDEARVYAVLSFTLVGKPM